MEQYRRRIVDSILADRLKAMGGVLILGPKWCGKTRTGTEFSRSKIELVTASQIDRVRMLVDDDNRSFLEGDTPILIDEWQMIPDIWNMVRSEIDSRSAKGQFILTGSSVPPEFEMLHSGAGRIARIRMRTMSLFESGESNSSISIHSLFNGIEKLSCESPLSIEDAAHAIIRGGWPDAVITDSTVVAKEYVSAIVESDLVRVVKSDVGKKNIIRMLESISRNISQPAKISTLQSDVGSDFTKYYAESYVETMKKMYLLENLPAWNPHMRSSTKLRKTSKWEFTDPSIAAAILNVNEEALMNDFESFGLLFESLALRDLRVYMDQYGGDVSYFRDENDHEVDFILEIPGGKWGAVEVKMGKDKEDYAASNLLRLKNKVDVSKSGEPQFLMILTAGRYGYRRSDGVFVVPIGCLGP